MNPADTPASSPRPGASALHVVHLVRTKNFAGVERYLTYLAKAQVEQGLNVTVIGGDPERMGRALGGTGVCHRPSVGALADLRVLLEPRPSALIHAHMTDAEVLSLGAKARHRIPVVTTLHFAKPRGRDQIRRLLLSPLPRLLDAQIAISHFVAEQSGEADAVVIPNGVPWDHQPRDRERVVLVTQRLETEKDTATAVRAWAASGLAGLGWRMTIAGEGSQRSTIAALIDQLGVSSTIDLVGAVDDIPERQARAGIFLATAPAEPFGLAVVEAMAAGTPVVAAGGGAHLETVGRLTSARLFEPGDDTGAGTQLRLLAEDDAARASYGDDLRAEYLENFTIERHADQVLTVYEQVMSKRTKASGPH